MLRQMEWGLQNESVTKAKSGLASNYFIFLENLFQFQNLLKKELI